MSLTARSYVNILFIVLLAISGQWWGDPLQHLWRYPSSVLLMALVYEALRTRGRRREVELILPARVYLGQPFEARWRIDNPTPRPLAIEIQAIAPPGMQAAEELQRHHIAADSYTSVAMRVVPQQLGPALWQYLPTRVLGGLGLAWWNRRMPIERGTQTVLDRLRDMEQAQTTQQSGNRQRPLGGAGNELLSLREYRPGDPLRAIDWKASARSGDMTVRLYSEEQHLELLLAIDAGRTSGLQAGSLTRLHHFANVAARLAQRAAHNDDHLGIVVFADEVLHSMAPSRGLPALHAVRDILAKLRTRPRESNPLAAVLEVRRLVRHRGLVVLLTDIDESSAASQLVKASRLLTPKHLPLVADLLDEDVMNMPLAASQDWLAPYNALAALEHKNAARATVGQLQRQGCHVLQALPQHLDNRLLSYYEELRRRHSV